MPEITKFKRMSHGIGGSYTRWQREPPAHGVFWVDTDEGQTAVTAYDTRGPGRDVDSVIDDGAMGPKNIPFKSEVDFSDLSEPLRDEIRDRIVDHFWDDGFFSDPAVVGE